MSASPIIRNYLSLGRNHEHTHGLSALTHLSGRLFLRRGFLRQATEPAVGRSWSLKVDGSVPSSAGVRTVAGTRPRDSERTPECGRKVPRASGRGRVGIFPVRFHSHTATADGGGRIWACQRMGLKAINPPKPRGKLCRASCSSEAIHAGRVDCQRCEAALGSVAENGAPEAAGHVRRRPF